ncbi:hypothetical protein PR048_001959 [Dryococelus australis]|uniref:Uncharacterized protein n=1 Tax=Dryococelus australis TaxID=614101 RepID=A0ABQ9IIT2_9NEOP|nr:hypothetical protein PR048_001959 [Dryococelus australis]
MSRRPYMLQQALQFPEESEHLRVKVIVTELMAPKGGRCLVLDVQGQQIIEENPGPNNEQSNQKIAVTQVMKNLGSHKADHHVEGNENIPTSQGKTESNDLIITKNITIVEIRKLPQKNLMQNFTVVAKIDARKSYLLKNAERPSLSSIKPENTSTPKVANKYFVLQTSAQYIQSWYPYREHRNGIFNIWLEHEVGGGTQEIGSCIMKYIKENIHPPVNKLILWSDSCVGQNRSIRHVLMLMYTLQNHVPFESITLRFLLSSHSFLPNDSEFGNVECDLKIQQRLHTDTDYMSVMKCCRKKNSSPSTY